MTVCLIWLDSSLLFGLLSFARFLRSQGRRRRGWRGRGHFSRHWEGPRPAGARGNARRRRRCRCRGRCRYSCVGRRSPVGGVAGAGDAFGAGAGGAGGARAAGAAGRPRGAAGGFHRRGVSQLPKDLPGAGDRRRGWKSQAGPASHMHARAGPAHLRQPASVRKPSELVLCPLTLFRPPVRLPLSASLAGIGPGAAG